MLGALCAGKPQKDGFPKIGDRIFVRGHPGVFVVFEIDTRFQTAQLVRIGTSYPVLVVEWRFLGYLDGEKGGKP